MLDFGAARQLDQSGQADAVGGSRMTLAPELRVGKHQTEGTLTPACDIFSAGTVIGRLAKCDVRHSNRVSHQGYNLSQYDYFCVFEKKGLAQYIAECFSDGYRCTEMWNSNELPSTGAQESAFYAAKPMAIVLYIATLCVRTTPEARPSAELLEELMLDYQSFIEKQENL